MGIYRFGNRYTAPSPKQRERYMKGEREEHLFGTENEILLVLYDEAAYLKDDREGVRILFTGIPDKQKAQDEVRRILGEHEENERQPDDFRAAGSG